MLNLLLILHQLLWKKFFHISVNAPWFILLFGAEQVNVDSMKLAPVLLLEALRFEVSFKAIVRKG